MSFLGKVEKSAVRIVPVVDTLAADLLTPLGIYLSLSRESKHSFLFESIQGGESLARYSFIGANPIEVLEGGKETFDRAVEHFRNHASAADPSLPPFIGGAVGFLGFDACEWFEASLESGGRPEGSCQLMVFRSITAFDHVKQVLTIISLAFIADEAQAEAEIELARNRNRSIIDQIRRRVDDPGSPHLRPGPTTSGWTPAGFEQAVAQIKEHIRAGDCYQSVLSQRFERVTAASPLAIYRALRSLNPSPYMFLMEFGDNAVVGASPEMLVRCRNGHLEYRPIAGTRRRGSTPAEDDALAKEMSEDTKETAEHLMLVDLGRNDLGRVCDYGTVAVDSLMKVEKYSHVQHLVSCLSGQLRGGLDRFDALAACFPAGTVSGAPKVRAIEILRELEPVRRGIYAGAVGYFDYAGNMDTCIAIRTIEIRDGRAYIQAGAGIVADSVPQLEFEETINKAKVLFRAIEIAEEGTR